MISVLYVDDEPALLEITKMFLEKNGELSIETVESARVAFDKLRTKKYDVIVSDYQMPEMDGIQFLQKLRAEENKTPFIIFTGKGRQDVVIQALNCGADFYLQKGGDPKSQFAELESKINQATFRRRAEEKVVYLNRVYTLLSKVNQSIVRISKREELFQVICDIAIEHGKFRMAWIGLIDEKSRTIRPIASSGAGAKEYLSTIRISIDDVPEGRGPSGRAVREGRPVISNDIRIDPQMIPWKDPAGKLGYHSGGAFPLRCKGKIIGEISLYAAEPDFFSEDEVSLLEEVVTDISYSLDKFELDREKQEAVEAFSESDAQYRTLFETMAQGVIYQDAAGKIISANPAAERILGLSLSQMLGKSSRDPGWKALREDGSHFPGDEHHSIAALRTGRPGKGMMGVFNPVDRNLHWILVTSVPQFRPGEKLPFRVFCTFEDITDRKLAEEKVLRNAEKFRNIFDTAPNLILSINPAGTIVTCNLRSKDTLGYEKYEIIGRQLKDFVNAGERGRLDGYLGEVLTGKTITGWIFRFQKKDFTEIDVTINATALRDGGGRYFRAVCIIEDITTQLKAQNDLLESERKFRLLVESAPDAIFIQTNSRFAYLNSAALSLFGTQSPGDLLDTHVADRFIPEDWAILGEMIQQLNNDQKSVPRREYTCLRLDGTPIEIEISAVPYIFGNAQGSLVFVRDISARKKGEKNFAEGRRVLETLLRNLPGMAYRCRNDPDWTMEFVSEGSLSLTGYHSTELVGNTKISYGSLIVPEDRGPVWELVQAGVNNHQPFLLKYRIIDREGILRRVWEQGRGVYSERGDLIALEGYIFDISEQERTEEALRESENKYRSIVEQSLIGIGISKGNQVLFANNALLRIFNYDDLEEFKKIPLIDHVAPSSYQFITDQRRMFAERKHPSGEFEFEYDILCKAGLTKTLHAVSTHLSFGGGVYTQTIFQDITDRKRAEAALHESRDRFRQIAEVFPETIFESDAEGYVTYANEHGLKEFGVTAEDVSKGLNIFDFVAPEDRAIVIQRVGVKLQGSPSQYMEYRAMRKDGSSFWAIALAAPIMVNGVESGLRGFIINITERKKMEEALQLAGRKLQLLSSITRHDIRNQLISLRGAINLIKRDNLDQETKKLIAITEKAAETIQDNIEFTTEYENLGMEESRWQSVNEIFHRATLQFLMCDVSIRMLPVDHEIFADPLLEKVFYNLLDNAFRHGKNVTCINLSCDETNSGLRIFVQDNGCGVSKEDKLLIFEQSFGKNTGLGLFLSREILSTTGITIEENGTPGEGAQFEILVPMGGYRIKKSSTI